MFDTIRALIPRDPDYPPRVATLDLLRRTLNGTLYDVLPYQFHEERSASGEYIPLRDRRPSVRYALPRIVVEDIRPRPPTVWPKRRPCRRSARPG
jgi:hypothetical protein